MPKIAYSEEERDQIRESLIAAGLELFSKQGIRHTTVEQIYQRVGISRTFFYSFFPAKEDLIVQAYRRQRPKIVAHARKLMEDPQLSWRDAIRQFLHDCCYSKETRFAVMTVEDQKIAFKYLSSKNYETLQENQLQFFSDLLGAFGIRTDEETAKFLWNFVLSLVIVRKAIPNTLPFLFPEAADAQVEFQIDALIRYMEPLREQQYEYHTTQEETNHGIFQ